MRTIRHGDAGREVVAAKLLTGYLRLTGKVANPEGYIAENDNFSANFTAYVVAWQGKHGLTPDGEIGPETLAAIRSEAPTCSTNRNRVSAWALAIQLLLNTNITCDGIYGPRTKAAVVAWQTAKGLAADGIVGPKTWAKLLAAEAQASGAQAEGVCEDVRIWLQPEDFKQGDSRWGKNMYSNHGDRDQTMANSGCGPTAMADIVATVKDRSQTPWTLAKLAMLWGDRTYSSGTAWKFMIPHIMEYFGFSTAIQTASLDVLLACLDAGGYAVCSMGPGYWTKGGHFICAWKHDDKYIYCNDPASSSRKKQEIAQFMKERKQIFCFYPEPAGPTTGEIDAGDAAADAPTVRGDKICDVSRSQGVINWDLLAPELAFVAIKASGLYKNGPDTQYANNVRGAVSHGVPFHAYAFLYCKNEAEARRDTALFYNTVKSGGHWPLFWVLDLEAGWGAKDRDVPALATAFEAELRRLCREDGPGEIRVAAYVAQEKYYSWALNYAHYAYIWIPGYGAKYRPKMPCDLWQHTSTGTLPGIKGRVDMDVLMGTKPMEFFTGGVLQ